jgi:hypothetical protein
LLAHLSQFVLHAVEDAAQIDRIHAIEFFDAGISGFHGGGLHAGIVECRIQATEYRDGLLDHGSHLSLVGDIATDGDRLMVGGDQFFYCGANCVLMDVRQRDGSPASAKALAVARPMPEAAPVTSATLSLKDQFTNVSLLPHELDDHFYRPRHIQRFHAGIDLAHDNDAGGGN